MCEALTSALHHGPTIAALVFSDPSVVLSARLAMATVFDAMRSMPEGLAGNDYKKCRQSTRPTPTRRTDLRMERRE